MLEYLVPLLAIGLGALALAVAQLDFHRHERPILWASFLAHILSSFAILLITKHYYGQGDMLGYLRRGGRIAQMLDHDFRGTAPEVVKLLFQQDTPLRMVATGAAATSSMVAVSAIVLYMFGGSVHAANLVLGFVALSGQAAMYRALRPHVPPARQRRVLVAVLLIPSVVFWSSGALKESVALAGLGWATLAALRLAYGSFRLRHALLLVPGIVLVAVVKPYILLPFALATGLAYYWRRVQLSGARAIPAIRLHRLALALVMALGGVFLVGKIYPRFAVSHIAEEAAELQELGETYRGGSTYSMGDPSQKSLVGQLAFAPAALGSALFRPFLFEVNNALSLANAIEASFFVALFLWLMVSLRPRGVVRAVLGSAWLMFCVSFVLVFSVGVGLATTNLGSLSRYRMPMLPMYLSVLLVLLPKRRRQGAHRRTAHSF